MRRNPPDTQVQAVEVQTSLYAGHDSIKDMFFTAKQHRQIAQQIGEVKQHWEKLAQDINLVEWEERFDRSNLRDKKDGLAYQNLFMNVLKQIKAVQQMHDDPGMMVHVLQIRRGIVDMLDGVEAISDAFNDFNAVDAKMEPSPHDWHLNGLLAECEAEGMNLYDTLEPLRSTAVKLRATVDRAMADIQKDQLYRG